MYIGQVILSHLSCKMVKCQTENNSVEIYGVIKFYIFMYECHEHLFRMRQTMKDEGQI